MSDKKKSKVPKTAKPKKPVKERKTPKTPEETRALKAKITKFPEGRTQKKNTVNKAQTQNPKTVKEEKPKIQKSQKGFDIKKKTKQAVETAGNTIVSIEDALDREPQGKTSRAREKREKRRILRRKIFLIVLALLIVLFLLGYFLFTIKRVQVDGNKFYDDEVISEMVLSDSNSWNALYVLFADKFLPKEKMPFIDDVEIKLTGRNSIKIEVFEKPTIGCIYVDGSGQYAYFDKDGIVCELSPDIMKGVPQIYGVSCFDADLYDDIELSDQSVLKTLLLLVVDLDKYGIPSDSITFQGSHIGLQYDHITVNLGTSQYLTEKLMRLTKVMPQLDALAGTLYLDTWTPENTDIVFKKQK